MTSSLMHCWWCTLAIEGEDINLPYKFEKEKFKTMGHFCSWECTKSYNIHENKIKFGEIQQFITLFRKRKYGKVIPLKCAPPRYVLKRYGGTISDEEYRSHVSELPPVVAMPDTQNFLHEVVIRKNKEYIQKDSEKKAKLNSIKNTNMTTETLNLRRSAPVKLRSNNLVDSLGLKVRV